MSYPIIYNEGAYNLYCTISDGAYFVHAITLDQLESYIKERWGQEGLNTLPERLDRAHKTGCSAYGETLSDCILLNRAGENEKHLQDNEFIEQFLTLRENITD